MLTSHRLTFTGLALACLTGFANAQGTASEISAMTCPATVIDVDNVGPAGPCVGRACPVTVAELNAAGSNGPGLLSQVGCTLNPSSTTGAYDTSLRGRALKCAPTSTTPSGLGTFLADPPNPPGTPTSTYSAVDYCFSFQHNHTQVGFQVGDWTGPLTLEFWDGEDCTGTMVARIATSTTFTDAAKFFAVRGDCFKSVAVRAPDNQRTANFVITEIHTERLTGSISDPTPSFNTCVGSNGQSPMLSAVALTSTPQIPEKCERLQLAVSGGTASAPAQLVINVASPISPISLGIIGGDPNCFVKIPLASVPIFLPPTVLSPSGTATQAFPVPARLCGAILNAEAWLADFGKPQPIKATTTNQLSLAIQ